MRRRVALRLARLQTITTFLNLAINDEIMSKTQFTETATQPQRNRKFCQFNDDQYCIRTADVTRWLAETALATVNGIFSSKKKCFCHLCGVLKVQIVFRYF